MTGRRFEMVLVLMIATALGIGCQEAPKPEEQVAPAPAPATPEAEAAAEVPADGGASLASDIREAPLTDVTGELETAPEAAFATVDIVLALNVNSDAVVMPPADVAAAASVDSVTPLTDAQVVPADAVAPADVTGASESPASPDTVVAPAEVVPAVATDVVAVATTDAVAKSSFDQDASRKVFEEFKKFVEKADFEKGAQLLEEWLKRSPMDLVNRQNLIHVLLKLEQYERALPHLQFMADEAESKGEWLGHLGRALVKVGEYARAAEALAAALELRPEDVDLLLDLARVHSTRKDWSASKAVLEDGLRGQKRLPELLTELAPVLVELGEYKDASARFKQLQRLQPSYETALTMAKIASQYERCEDVVDALADWEKDFLDETPHLLLGACASKADEKVKAQKHFLLGLKANDKCFYCAMWLGDIYLDSQDWENAVKYYALAAPINPRDHRPFHQLGKALANQGKHIEAARALQKADERKPKDVDILYPLGMELVQAGEKAAAWDVWAKLEPLHREHADEIKALLIPR